MDRAQKFFSEAENDAITRAIKDAESNTSGEIAVMVVDRSDSYGEASALGAVTLAGIIALCLELAVSAVLNYSNIWSGSEGRLMSLIESSARYASLWTFIPLAFILYFPSRLLFTRFPVLSTFFMTRKRIHEAVRERAVRAFYEKELHRTRDETGVLLFISLLERLVWIIGDRGINEKIEQSFWNERAEELTAGIRARNHGAAACAVIARCGEELARHFPRKPDDTNELSDRVIT